VQASKPEVAVRADVTPMTGSYFAVATKTALGLLALLPCRRWSTEREKLSIRLVKVEELRRVCWVGGADNGCSSTRGKTLATYSC
jgi:hypothetical protein